jgi:hypothetical protein
MAKHNAQYLNFFSPGALSQCPQVPAWPLKEDSYGTRLLAFR